MKCYKLVFCINSITINYGSIILIILFLIHICIFIIYLIKGTNPLLLKINKMKENMFIKSNKNILKNKRILTINKNKKNNNKKNAKKRLNFLLKE